MNVLIHTMLVSVIFGLPFALLCSWALTRNSKSKNLKRFIFFAVFIPFVGYVGYQKLPSVQAQRKAEEAAAAEIAKERMRASAKGAAKRAKKRAENRLSELNISTAGVQTSLNKQRLK